MTEFRYGIFQFLKKQLQHSSVARAIVYTLGHIVIAMTCNNIITGAAIELAALDALIEPIINGFWYFLLDKFWTRQIYQTDEFHNPTPS